MAVVINVVERLDDRGIKVATKQMTAFASRAAADQKSIAGAWIRQGRAITQVGTMMSGVGKSMTKYVTVPIIAAAALSVRAAMKQQQAFAVLDLQTRKNTAATKAQTKAVDAFVIAQAEATGNAVKNEIPVMSRLEIATRNRTKAEQLLKVAEDVSAGTGKNLSVVGLALSRAYQGNTTSLGRLGIKTSLMEPIQKKVTAAMALASKGHLKAGQTTEVLTKKTMTFAQLLPRVIKAYGGDAAKAADTTAGRFDRFKVAVDELAVQFGADLLPIVDKGLGYLDRMTGWLSGLSPATRKWIEQLALGAAVMGPLLMGAGFFITKLGQMATGIGVAGSGIKALGGGLKGLKAFMSMSSLATMGWVAVIIAVIAALVLAYIKVKWFRDAVNDCVRFIVRVFKDFGHVVGGVFSFLRRNFKTFLDYLIIGSGPIGWITAYTIEHFHEVKTAVGDVLSWLWSEWKWVWNNILKWTPLGAVVGIFETLGSEIASHWNGIVKSIDWAINEIDKVLNVAFSWCLPHKLKTDFGSGGSSSSSKSQTTKTGTGRTAQGGGGAGKIVGDIGSAISHTAGSVWNGASDAAKFVYDAADFKFPGVGKLPGPLSGLYGGLEKLIRKAIEGLIGGGGSGSLLGHGSPNAIVSFAESFLGVPYLWGGISPRGWDCSGFVQFVYKHFGVNLMRTAAQMQQEGRPVTGAMRPSDLVFFGQPAHHVGMYVGGNTMIDAPHTGAYTRFDNNFTGWGDYAGARRYIAAKFGGTFSGPNSGYPAILHGQETVVSHAHPQRGLAGLAAAGVGGETVILNLNFPEGIVVSDPEKFGRAIAPIITRAQNIAAARRNRGRVGS